VQLEAVLLAAGWLQATEKFCLNNRGWVEGVEGGVGVGDEVVMQSWLAVVGSANF
jgi:hypothetical protein